MSKEFWNLLFRPGEQTCFAKNKYGTQPRFVSDTPNYQVFEYFSINPLVYRRLDGNVISYRNILIEFDKMALGEQQNFVEKIGLPWSTCVFSGSKSFHFLISLKEDLPDLETYKSLVARIYKACPGVDLANANPSRLSRVPGHLRASTDQIQKLIAVKEAVYLEEIEDWLDDLGIGEIPKFVPPPVHTPADGEPEWFTDIFLNRRTKRFLETGELGSGNESRHLEVVIAAYDFARVGKTQEEAFRRLLDCSGLESEDRQKEVQLAIKSCFQKIGRQ